MLHRKVVQTRRPALRRLYTAASIQPFFRQTKRSFVFLGALQDADSRKRAGADASQAGASLRHASGPHTWEAGAASARDGGPAGRPMPKLKPAIQQARRDHILDAAERCV